MYCYRLVTIAVVVVVTGTSFLYQTATAQEDPCAVAVPGRIFCDNFNDGNATDGVPGTWLPGASPGGTRDATSGDFVVTHSAGTSSFVEELNGVRDVSIRTQISMSNTNGSVDAAGVWARSPLNPNFEDPAAYVGGINTNGVMFVGHNNSQREFTSLRSLDTSIDPTGSDVFLQFDVIGNELSLTAWQDGVDKIQVTATDTNLTEGGQVGLSFTSGGGTGSATFRYYEVVPEPSAAALTCLGFLTLFAWRRTKKAKLFHV